MPGRTVIKPVVVRADGQWVMCALPASYKVDLVELASQLLAERVELVTESELRSRFADCECGAEPPIGLLYGMPTLMDESLVRDTHVIFSSRGRTSTLVVMTAGGFIAVWPQPEMAHFRASSSMKPPVNGA